MSQIVGTSLGAHPVGTHISMTAPDNAEMPQGNYTLGLQKLESLCICTYVYARRVVRRIEFTRFDPHHIEG